MATGTYTCAHCKKEFTAIRNPHRDNKFYCSPECQRDGRRKEVTLTCTTCGNSFVVNPTRIKHGNPRFCSVKCKSESGKAIITCKQCGESVKVRRHIVESGKYTGQFCSYSCAAKWQKGENHNNWQGGHVKWRGPNWKKQKNKARERDNYTCQNCGITEQDLGRPMDVHHIHPWRNFDNNWTEANTLDNLVSLCPKCHPTIERSLVNHYTHTNP